MQIVSGVMIDGELVTVEQLLRENRQLQHDLLVARNAEAEWKRKHAEMVGVSNALERRLSSVEDDLAEHAARNAMVLGSY